MSKQLYAWEEKYAPQTVAELILPKATKDKLQSYVDAGDIPNLLLAGRPGVGKTASVMAMTKQLGCDVLKINASLNGNIDTLRNDIAQFASTVSLLGGRKYVILDEADYLNAQSFQPALRGFIQDFKQNCGFILTCNYKSRLIEPIRDSRLSVIDYTIPSNEKTKMLVAQLKRAFTILDAEGVDYDKEVIAQLVDQYFPDFRKVIIELQAYYRVTGKIDTGILATARNEDIHTLIGYLKEKNFTNVRKWVAESGDITVFRSLYEEAHKYFATSYIPQLVLTTAQYQFWGTSAVDEEINITAFLTEVMADAVWLT